MPVSPYNVLNVYWKHSIHWVWYLFYSKIYWISFVFFLFEIQFSQWWNVSFTLQKSIYYDYYFIFVRLWNLMGKSTNMEKTNQQIIEMLLYKYIHVCECVWVFVRVVGVKRMEFGKCLQNMFQIMKAPKGWKVVEMVQT